MLFRSVSSQCSTHKMLKEGYRPFSMPFLQRKNTLVPLDYLCITLVYHLKRSISCYNHFYVCYTKTQNINGFSCGFVCLCSIVMRTSSHESTAEDVQSEEPILFSVISTQFNIVPWKLQIGRKNILYLSNGDMVVLFLSVINEQV